MFKNDESVLEELGIAYEDLDVFMTHKHHDHSGLASIYADRRCDYLYESFRGTPSI